MTGGRKSTPIREMETLSGIQSIEDRRDSKTLLQEKKYKRLPSLPMHKRLRTQKSKPRLKKESFIVNVKTLRKSMDISTGTEPEQVTVANPCPAWKTKHRVEILETFNGIESKSAMNPLDISTKAKSTIEKTTLSKNGSGYIYKQISY